jgi:2,4-dienoyl-CoA reductase-like NADH-dependent reductase (Old Yellow Enzyme family)/threonine dehydrogenase-like Zn-dependent dehydrogenase
MRLLEPVRVGSLEVQNRVVSTAHGAFLDFYRPGVPGGRYTAYQERRARGGTGLIVLQPMHVHPSSHALGHYTYDPDDVRPKLRALADAVHAHGTRVVLQLIHFGAQFRSDARADLEPLWAFDELLSPEGEAAHRMTSAEVEEVVEAYGTAAELAVDAGLDGVELHGTHGYLLQQSWSPWGNRRDDGWGEPLAFARAVIGRVRRRLGSGPVVGIRVSADDFVRPAAGGLGAEGIRDVVRTLVAEGGLDYVNHSEGARTGHYARSVASYRHPEGEFLPLARGLKEAVESRVPVIGVGRIASVAVAERALQAGDCDLVAMTRAQIADPDLVRKLRDGRRLRPCVAANQGCVDRMVGGLPITCFHNPDVGREERGEPAQADGARRVVVVGGGPAGLKAAEVAARRGHAVLLVEREDELGGRLRFVRGLGAAAELFRAVTWLEEELRELAVEVRLGTDAGEPELAGADVVVLATGSRPAPERIGGGDGSVPLLSLDDALRRGGRGRLLLVDLRGDLETALAAEQLAADGAELTIATPAPAPCPHVGFTHVRDLLVRFHELGCALEPSTVLVRIEGGRVLTRHLHTGGTAARGFDAVVAGVQGRSVVALAPAVERAGARLLVAGDAVAPRTALHAFREGDDAGRQA